MMTQMMDYAPFLLPALALGLTSTALLILSRSPVAITVVTALAASVGLYVCDRLHVPPNLLKNYCSLIFGASFVVMGRVGGFRTRPWEYTLLAFYIGRVVVDFLRPDFVLRFTFGGTGDGLFLTAGYFYYKKVFVARPEEADRVLRTLLYAGVLLALPGLVESVTGRDLFGYADPRFFIEQGYRANSVFRGPENLGASGALTFFVALLLYWRGTLRANALYGWAAVLLLGTIAALYRGIWLAFAAAVVCLRFAETRRPRLPRLAFKLVTTSLLGLCAVVMLWYVLRGTSFYEQRLANPENWFLRLTIYETLARGIAASPWLGHGTGTVEEYLANSWYNTTDLYTSHNGYLTVLYENGAIFCALYLAWFAALLGRVRFEGSRSAVACGAMLVTLLITNLTLDLPLAFIFFALPPLVTAALATAEEALHGSSDDAEVDDDADAEAAVGYPAPAYR
ncbi:MAG: O-antigen ligase family protein [Gemmatimonadaceae bacterium]